MAFSFNGDDTGLSSADPCFSGHKVGKVLQKFIVFLIFN